MSQFSAAVLALSPAAYWPMQEVSGNLLDISGNASQTMIANGSPVYALDGPFPGETAIGFNNSTADYFEIAAGTTCDVANTFSVGFWSCVNTQVTAAYQVSHGTGGYGVTAPDNTGVQILWQDTAGNILKANSALSTLFNDNVSSAGSLRRAWYYTLFTKSGATSVLYTFGVSPTALVTGLVTAAVTTTDRTCTSGGVTTIGRQSSNTSGPVNGKISHVAIWTTALSAANALALQNAAQQQLQETILASGNGRTERMIPFSGNRRTRA